MRIDDIDKWAGSVVVVTGALAVIGRWMVRPLWRGLKRANEVFDQFLGDKKTPGVLARLESVEGKVDAHGQIYHPPAPVPANGGHPVPGAPRARHERR